MMIGPHTAWICPDCVKVLEQGTIAAGVEQQGSLALIEPGSLVTMGFRDPDDHHTDCDLRVSVMCGDHGYDCNVSCEDWDECPDRCHGCGAAPGPRKAATVWPAPVTA